MVVHRCSILLKIAKKLALNRWRHADAISTGRLRQPSQIPSPVPGQLLQ
jgi:hypothetical protein